jgi:segregation and condensation protein B
MSLKSKIESLLFISAHPLSEKKIAELAGAKADEVKTVIYELISDYNERGIKIARIDDEYQMSTANDNAALIRDFIKDETNGELTRPSLETLTIIAYRGPITKAELEQIRGVNCGLILRNLMIRGLVEAGGGGEQKYNITFDFLRFLGIKSVTELPDFEKLSRDPNLEKFLENQIEPMKEAS